MINNKKRREVAAKLRESRDFISGLSGGAIPKNAFDTFERILECIDYQHGNVFDFIADLIDIPTTRIGIDENGRAFCACCGCSYLFLDDDGVRYCSSCGCEVVE